MTCWICTKFIHLQAVPAGRTRSTSPACTAIVIRAASSRLGSLGSISFIRMGCVRETRIPLKMVANPWAGAAMAIDRRWFGFTVSSSGRWYRDLAYLPKDVRVLFPRQSIDGRRRLASHAVNERAVFDHDF